MTRLRKTIISKSINGFKSKRNKRRYVFAEWVPTESTDPNAIQYTTDVMALGGAMQIQYQDGGYRTIYPYGWNTSKDGNVLIMCYKDDGGLRSYRLDRIQQFLFDSSVVEEIAEETETTNPSLEVSDYDSDNTEDSLPELPPDEEEVQQVQELPFDEAIDTLQESDVVDNFDEENKLEENTEELEDEVEEPKSASNKIKRLQKRGR